MADDTALLIERLLDSGKLSPDTRDELRDFQQQLAKGGLDGADRRYVEALASRLLGVGTAANDDVAANDDGALDDDLWSDDGEDAEVTALRERAEAAEARVAELQQEVAELKAQLGQA